MASSEKLKFSGLPLTIAQPVDIGRLIREVDKLDEDLRQGHIRQQDGTSADLKLSPKLRELMDYNKVNILDNDQRLQLQHFLEAVKTQAPSLHISFGSEASENFIIKLMTWLRTEISPVVLLTVGLEPDIGAGCTVRTNNKYFDFSLKTRLKQNRELLMQQIQKSIAAATAAIKPVPQPKEAVVTNGKQ